MNSNNHEISLLEDCHIITLDRHSHENGSLSVIENTDEFPFNIRRIFYLYDIPGDSESGGHSHHEAQEFIIAAKTGLDALCGRIPQLGGVL